MTSTDAEAVAYLHNLFQRERRRATKFRSCVFLDLFSGCERLAKSLRAR